MTGAALTSDEEKEAWQTERIELTKSYKAEIEKLLTNNMLRLASNKNWMRMRVHLGHIVFTFQHNDFKTGKQSFQTFNRMLSNPRVAGALEREYVEAVSEIVWCAESLMFPLRLNDASIATKFRAWIVDSKKRYETNEIAQNVSNRVDAKKVTSKVEAPKKKETSTKEAIPKKEETPAEDHYRPVGGNVACLEDVKWRDTEIVFVSRPGLQTTYRLEADIDHDYDDETDHYNIGTTRFFYDNRRNKMMDITVIDVEK